MMAEQSWLDRLFQRPWGLLVLALYFASVAGLQLLASPTAELDQSEQLILSQHLAWGYTNQPPLYTWVMWGVFQCTGPSLAALYLVKVLLLTMMVWAVCGVARQLAFSGVQRQVALSGMFLLPTFVWESQRDLTHSLSAATFAALTLWAALCAVKHGQLWRYALLGVVASASLLSKHNTVVFLVGLLLALLSDRAWRDQLRLSGVLLATAVTAALCLPHGLWLLHHQEVLVHTMSKINHGQGGLLGAGRFLGDLMGGLVSFLLPWAGLALVVAWRRGLVLKPVNLLARLLACTFVALVVFVLAAGADSFKGRWLFPMLFAAPIWLGAVVRPDDRRSARWSAWSAVAVALLCGVIMPARLVWKMPGAIQTRQNLPFPEMVIDLQRDLGHAPAVVLASSHLVGGNFRLGLPAGTAVLTPIAPWRSQGASEAVFVASDKDLGDPAMQAWFVSQTGVQLDQVTWSGELSAPLLHRPGLAPYVLKWARVPLAR